jgi:hypothetical protein
MKLLYKPLGIMAGFISSRVGRSVFQSLWMRIDEEPPPRPGTGEGTLGKVVAAQALQAGVMAATAATVNRLFARLFHHLVGAWPEKPPESEPED